MRGYDSVSFTFALEVTWSKIQQKQQEEEDRKALEELQALQEMQEENGEEDDDDDNGQKLDTSKEDAIEMEVDSSKVNDEGNETKKALPAKKAAEVEEAVANEMEMDDFIVNDSEDENDSVETKEAENKGLDDVLVDSDSDDGDSDNSEEVVAAVTVESSEESSGESSPEKSSSSSSSGSVAEAEVLSSASPCADNTQDAEIVDSPGEKSTVVVEKSLEWQCAACTFMNPASR